MKYPFYLTAALLGFTLFAGKADAQKLYLPKDSLSGRLFTPKVYATPRYKPFRIQPKRLYPDSIANAGMRVLKLKNELVYQGSNGKGFDSYKSKVDNMPILMPDKNTKKMLGITK